MSKSQLTSEVASVLRLMLWLGAVLAMPAVVLAQALPATRLASVFPPGGSPGGSFEITITGANLDDVNRLVFTHAGIAAKQKMAEPGPFDKGPQPVPNTFVVTVAANVPPGSYEVRAGGKYGLSNPRILQIDPHDEAIEVEPNNLHEQATEITVGCSVSGRMDQAADVDYYKFTANAGQRILVDCHAYRIDSKMDAVACVYDASGRELSSSRHASRIDPLCDFTVPATGEYCLKIYDSTYRGGPDYIYRFTLGPVAYIDFVFPPAGTPGSRGAFTVYGRNLPGGQNAGITVDGRPLQRVQANIALPTGAAAEAVDPSPVVTSAEADLDAVSFRLGGSDPVLVGVATAPVVVEKEPNNLPAEAQKLTLPCEVAGQFYPRGDRDWVTFDATKGDVYTIEVISQRLGRTTDPNLVVLQVVTGEEGEEKVNQIAVVDDSRTPNTGPPGFRANCDDPIYRFQAPADGTYRVLVRDPASSLKGDPRNVYRLAIRQPKPDFRLVAVPDVAESSCLIRRGGQARIRLLVLRRDGFDGEIQVAATGLPGGVTCPGIVIGPKQNGSALVLTAAENAAAADGIVQITGKATIGGAAVTRVARTGVTTHALARPNNNQPPQPGDARLSRNLAVSVSGGELSPFSVVAGQNKVWEVSRAGTINIPYTVARRGNFKAKIDVTPRGLPANVTTPGNKFVVNPNIASGQFRLDLKANAPTGTYTIVLDSLGVVSYSVNPEAAAAAAERKKELDKLAVDTAAAAKAATDKKTAADQAATNATNAATAATNKLTAAKKTLTDADAAVKAAVDKVAQAKAALAKTPDDANLKAAVTAAEKVLADAVTGQKNVAAAVTAAEKEVGTTTAAAKAATDAQAVATKAAEEATALSQAATAAKAEGDRQATATTNRAKAANRNLVLPSTAVVLKIGDPVTVKATAPTAALKQGASVEVPVALGRQFGFAGEVNLSIVLPGGVGGLQIPAVKVPANQVQGKLALTAAANATPGTHRLVVRATVNHNKQNVTVDQPITLTVEKVDPAQTAQK